MPWPSWKKWIPFRFEPSLSRSQMEDLQKAFVPLIGPGEMKQYLVLTMQANSCRTGHCDQMATLCKLAIALAYVHTLAFVLIPAPQRWWITLPALLALGLLVGKMIREHLWSIRDREHHIQLFADFALKQLHPEIPKEEELENLLKQVFGSTNISSISVEDFFNPKGGEDE